MSDVPDWIWAAPDSDDGWRWPAASKFPMQGQPSQFAFIREDLHKSALDAAEADTADLKHDLDRYMTIAATEASRVDAAEADKKRAVEREQRLARRIHMQRAQLRWLNAWMAGDLQITRMQMLRKTLLTKRVPTSFGPDPSALRAVWDVVLRRVYGTSAIRAQGGEG